MSEETVVRTQRYGGVAAGKWSIYKISAITSAMAVPSTANDGIRSPIGKSHEFCVLMPAGVTSYVVTTYRQVGADRNKVAVVPSTWVPYETSAVQTASGFFEVPNRGDRVAIRIHTIVGTPGASFEILYKLIT